MLGSLYFAHPQSHYFQLGRIDKDQVEDYSNARDESIDENEIWLAPSSWLLGLPNGNKFGEASI